MPSSLDELWPDPDRRDAALERVARSLKPPRDDQLRPSELRVLEAISHVGLDMYAVAELTGYTYETVKDLAKRARRVLGAKDTTQACCEALRLGLIR